MDHLCVGYLSPPLLIFVRVITTSEPASEVPIPPHPWGRLCHIVVCRISLCLALRIPSKTVRGRCDWNSLQPLLATSWVLSHQREKEEKSSWHLLYIIGASCGVALLYGFELLHTTRWHTLHYAYPHIKMYLIRIDLPWFCRDLEQDMKEGREWSQGTHVHTGARGEVKRIRRKYFRLRWKAVFERKKGV